MKITDNKILWLIENEIKLRAEARAEQVIRAMTDEELLAYKKKLSIKLMAAYK